MYLYSLNQIKLNSAHHSCLKERIIFRQPGARDKFHSTNLIHSKNKRRWVGKVPIPEIRWISADIRPQPLWQIAQRILKKMSPLRDCPWRCALSTPHSTNSTSETGYGWAFFSFCTGTCPCNQSLVVRPDSLGLIEGLRDMNEGFFGSWSY